MVSGGWPVFSAIDMESAANSSLTLVIRATLSFAARAGGTFLKSSSLVCPLSFGFSILPLFSFISSTVFLIFVSSVVCFLTLSALFPVSFSRLSRVFLWASRFSASSFLVSVMFWVIFWKVSSALFSLSSSFLKKPICVFSSMLELVARFSSTLPILWVTWGSTGIPR